MTKVPNIDQEDLCLTVEQLREKYDTLQGWGDHPVYSMKAWRFNVGEGNTRLGYWEWVKHTLDAVGDYAEDVERRIREDEP